MEFLVSCRKGKEISRSSRQTCPNEFQVQSLGAVTPEKGENRILGVVPSFSLV